MEQARGFFKKAIDIIKKPEMRVLPGQLAFFLVMSLIPLAALLGALASTLSIPVTTLENVMSGVFPDGVISFIIDIINNKGPNFNIIVFFISAFILASNGASSMINVSNEIYKVTPSNVVNRRIKAIMMTFVLGGLFFILFLIPISGEYIFELIKNNASNEKIINFIYLIYEIIKYPLLIIILHFNIKLLYVMAPDENIIKGSTTKGSIFTTIGWIIATEIFSFYIGTFTSYDMFYGSISNIIILLLWIYILSYIFLLGMIINAGVHKELTEELKIDLETKEEESNTEENRD